ncbi:MAG: hypothetical protein DYG96_08975 [Chlorobi bacterium CHB2]|nr:hypothetical protein [Chlorobi bacterium CHB2]
MKRTWTITALLFLLAIGAQAQDNTVARTAMGDKALMFSINGFGDFGVTGVTAGSSINSNNGGDSANSGGVSPVYGAGAKFFLQNNVALRGVLGFGSSSGSGSQTAFGFLGGVEYHILGSGAVSGYGGAFLSYATRSRSSGEEMYAYSSSSSSLGIGGMMGVEFFPWRDISFSAEYQLGLRLNSGSTTTAGSTTDAPGTTEIGIGSASVMIAVYL